MLTTLLLSWVGLSFVAAILAVLFLFYMAKHKHDWSSWELDRTPSGWRQYRSCKHWRCRYTEVRLAE